ncbi:hypothetical protein [Anabaena sp. PCC 7108]|uniref:hypothetical protein n=1 Tax=Anabaena sp. PCC 7108 TaxID=163908 RepID=UPI00035E3195|nr:hypothetical protein [Anabaena sp. PCC 7108]
MNKSAIIPILERISANKDGNNLTHSKVRVLAYGILFILDDIIDIASQHREEIEAFLKMLTKFGIPHHARCYLAHEALALVKKDDGTKKFMGSTSPTNF